MGDLRFFYDGISQPSRAVWLLLDASGVKYEPCLVDLIKREFTVNIKTIESMYTCSLHSATANIKCKDGCVKRNKYTLWFMFVNFVSQ